MIFIPDTPVITSKEDRKKKSAEIKVFKALKKVFRDDDHVYVFHSLNLPFHYYKKVGEADFVIVSHFGIVVLEVKGGGLSYEGGVWKTRDRYGDQHSIQDPFVQARDAVFALGDRITGQSNCLVTKLSVGYGVVFPDCSWTTQGEEWDRSVICDAKNMRSIESWLTKLFRHWQDKPNNSYRLSPESIREVANYLRPNFEMVQVLFSQLEDIEERYKSLTQDQCRFVSLAACNKRVMCEGGAGTGKTFLAAELARRKSAQGKTVLVVCKSPWLESYLRTLIMGEGVTVSTVEAVPVEARRAGIESYNVLIVDEGQDIFNEQDMDILEQYLTGGLLEGEWCIFHDFSNQSDLVVGADKKVFEYLSDEELSVTSLPLETNCRNTWPILKHIQESLHVDMGVQGTGQGPVVQDKTVKKGEDVDVFLDILKALRVGDVPPGNITVLSPLPFEQSLVSRLPDKYKQNILKLDDYAIRHFPPQKINFAEIKDFKGLENDVVIVVDLPHPSMNKQRGEPLNQHYVGMSRARGLLCLIWVDE